MHKKEDKDEELQSKKSQAARQESPFIHTHMFIIKWTHLNATIYSCSPKAIPAPHYQPNKFTFARLAALCRRAWGLLNIFGSFKIQEKKNKTEIADKYNERKTKDNQWQLTNSYTAGEKFSNKYSNAIGQIFGRDVITRRQNCSFHHHYVAHKQIFA